MTAEFSIQDIHETVLASEKRGKKSPRGREMGKGKQFLSPQGREKQTSYTKFSEKIFRQYNKGQLKPSEVFLAYQKLSNLRSPQPVSTIPKLSPSRTNEHYQQLIDYSSQ